MIRCLCQTITSQNHSIKTFRKDGAKKNSYSQLGRDLSSTLRHLVHIKMEGDAILEAEEATAAVLLEDGLHRQIGRFAEEHQQVSIQKPGQTEEWLIVFHRKYVLQALYQDRETKRSM